MSHPPLEELSLGLPAIDEDHARSIALWRTATDAAPAEFAARLAAFVDHLAEHFAREEELMRAIAHKEIAHHAAEHARVIVEGRRFVAQATAGRTMMARAWTADWVPDWFRRHVTMYDSEVARVAKAAAAG